jgi:rod shape-determining protein MreC
MRNIFLFIRRYFTFFVFLVLQAISLWFLFNYNRFHRARFLGIANEVTGRINTQYNFVEDYFTLKEENRRVHRMNDSLLNLLPANFNPRDTSVEARQDSIPYDTLGNVRRYLFRPATVVYNTVNAEKNYIQINRGAQHGIADNMAVINSEGHVVGMVVNVSPNFAQVMSLLHMQHTVSAALKKNGEIGTVEWDGKDPRYLLLKRIPRAVEVARGDTVLTSPVSFNFPPNYVIGTVDGVSVDGPTGTYVLRLKTAANFYNLQQVHVIENVEREEQVDLYDRTKKKIEDVRRNPR